MSRILPSSTNSRKFDVRKRDSSWTMVKPGLYLDPAGYGHVFPDEIIAELQCLYPEVPWDYETDYDMIVQVYKDLVGPDHTVKIIKHIREED